MMNCMRFTVIGKRNLSMLSYDDLYDDLYDESYDDSYDDSYD